MDSPFIAVGLLARVLTSTGFSPFEQEKKIKVKIKSLVKLSINNRIDFEV